MTPRHHWDSRCLERQVGRSLNIAWHSSDIQRVPPSPKASICTLGNIKSTLWMLVGSRFQRLLRHVKHHRVSPFVQVFPFYLCFISYLETLWYLPSFTYLSIWLIPISHYLQKLVVTRQITSHHFASSLSVHSEYLSFNLCHPASRTFVQHFPSPASIALCPVLHPVSSLVFSIEFSIVLSLLTLCATLAFSCLISVPSPPSFPHLTSSFHIVSTFSKVWDSSGSHHFSTVLDSRPYYIKRTTEGVPLHFRGF